ncbi:MAG: hypothetical protein CMJ42_16765 [Phyllobacteriaceae bacterium]|nr:hypothetical protein [Phyllobacteriaceae bacterium]
MRFLFLFIALFFIAEGAYSQTPTLNQFYRQNKRNAEVRGKLPGWLLRIAGKIAIDKNDKIENRELNKELIKSIGKMRFLYNENRPIPGERIEQLRQDLHQESFEDLIRVRSEGIRFEFLIRESDGLVKNLVMVYSSEEDGEMAFFSIKTSLNLNELAQFLEANFKKDIEEWIPAPLEEEPVDDVAF